MLRFLLPLAPTPHRWWRFTTAICRPRRWRALSSMADWVILSACNTAAGGAQGDEALSDLARGLHLCRGKRPVAKLERAGLWVERLV